MKNNKTNAMRQLDTAKIQYTVKEYEVDENDLSGVHVATQLGQPVEQVFKTLVLRGDKIGYFVCCLPVAQELDLKKVARVSGNKHAEMIPMKDLPGVTGYVRGGCSPIGMKKKFPTFIDETCILFDEIAVSAGVRGMQIIINPQTLIDFVDATVSDLTAY